jgi:NADH-quinone oxidoreductase subunit N
MPVAPLPATDQLFLSLLPDLVVMAGAMAVLLFAVWRSDDAGRGRRATLLAMGVTLLGATAVLVAAGLAPPDAPRGIAVDPYRWGADLVILAAAALTLGILRDHPLSVRMPSGEPSALVLLAASGMMLLAAARDLMLVFLGIELMSVASYVLAGSDRRNPRGAEAALKYFILGAFASGFLLYGIALLYGATGSTLLPVIGEALAAGGTADTPMAVLGLMLLLVGFAFKVAAVPFHMWTPDVYDGAPSPFSGFFAAAVKAGTFAAFVRVCLEAVPAGAARWHDALWWLAVFTMAAGNLFAIQQRNVKRLLAYSSIAHAGFLLVALVTQTTAGAAAVLFYLAAYALATLGAFAIVSWMADGQDGPAELRAWEGLWQVRPGMAMAMAVFMLALLGFPLAGGMGFFAKWYVLQAALQTAVPETTLAIILVLTTVVSASFYLYVVMVMFMRARPDDLPSPPRVGGVTRAVVGVAVTTLLVFGVFPSPIVRAVRTGTAAAFPGRDLTPTPLAPQPDAPAAPAAFVP